MKIEISNKEGMTDPRSGYEAQRVKAVFPDLPVTGVKVGRVIGFVVEAEDKAAVVATTEQLAGALLVSRVLENYEIMSIKPQDSSIES